MEIMTGAVLDINNAYRSYSDYKKAMDEELQKSAESFVRIGYLLKVARDTDILQESGYRSVNEFAQAEYSLDKSQVSRFIRINDEFSENGYSDQLQEKYRRFGYSKLSLMLLLPAEINEEISADFTKMEIQAVKDEIDEEKKVTDLEVMLEEKDTRQQDRGVFGKVLYQIGRDDPEMYLKLYKAVMDTVCGGASRPVIDKMMDALAPAGEKIISVRIPGEGRKMLSVKGPDVDPVVIDVRSGKKQSCKWDDLIEEMEKLCGGENGENGWEILYGEPFPEKKQEVAPVQPKKEQNSGSTGRVTKAKKPENTHKEQGAAAPAEGTGQQAQKTEAEEPEKLINTHTGQEPEEQEAAGVEKKENGESEAQGETGSDDAEDEEPSADPEHGDDEADAIGGTGEGGSGGGKVSEEQREQQLIKDIKGKLLELIQLIKNSDWAGTIDKSRDINYIADALRGIELRRKEKGNE